MGTFYVPIGIAVLGMLIRYKSFRAPLKANWDLAKGGLFPESKTGFVKRFPQDHPLLPSEILLEGTLTLHEATTLFEGFFNGLHQAQPVVLKPDDGIQGRSVYFINSVDEFQAVWNKYIKGNGNWLLQEYIGGLEVAVFYLQDAPDKNGRIASMTWKHGFEVTGDGRSSVEALIHSAPGDEATKRRVTKFNRDRLNDIVAAGESLDLIPVRNHHLGATFQDISDWMTPELEAAICPVLDVLEGYNYGRLDIRAPDFNDLLAGKNIKILEANALYSEPVHAYDPKYGLAEAYRIFINYWNMACKIGVRQKKI